MEMPNVQNVLNDTENGIRYEVYAYRALRRQELIEAVRYYLSTKKRKPKRGSRIEIVTVIGARG